MTKRISTGMMKLLYIITRWRRPPPAPDSTDWRDDPLSHPAIRAMDPDELADLPFASMRGRRRG